MQQTHPEAQDRDTGAQACPGQYHRLRERLRDVLGERRKWTAMPQLLDEVDACRRVLARQTARLDAPTTP